MYNKIITGIAGVVFACLCINVNADVLPKSGTINLQSIYKGTSLTKFNDDYSHGTLTGVTFNEMGKGPLHLGKAACSFSIFTHKKINKSAGFCAYEDSDGDKVFIRYVGKSDAVGEWNGADEIIGGTGKFDGIMGSGTDSCANTDKKGEFPCTAKLEYRLP
ncbi:hypothetical protein [Cellvibrio mixtus]|uniref:hypothetical protein n=1 Tax=Cellvibrio mixtus TaxID=39650 RepID=UPI000587E851|nr:hypothetical protein [Cellvibrio mixtus]